jgi:hypothetical protein
MSGKRPPKWMKPARDRRCGQCGWQRPGHSPGCPSRFWDADSAEAVYWWRLALMSWADSQRHELGTGQQVAACMIALNGRARELGCEFDLPDDLDWLPAVQHVRR